MREILFRGKRLDNGEWVYGLLTIMWEEYHIISRDNENVAYQVDPETVGQYTGLNDKNGKRIFEGDIVEHHIQSDIIVNRGVVNWDGKSGRWALKLNTMQSSFAFYNPATHEVIGNIYDKPELLKGGDEG